MKQLATIRLGSTMKKNSTWALWNHVSVVRVVKAFHESPKDLNSNPHHTRFPHTRGHRNFHIFSPENSLPFFYFDRETEKGLKIDLSRFLTYLYSYTWSGNAYKTRETQIIYLCKRQNNNMTNIPLNINLAWNSKFHKW